MISVIQMIWDEGTGDVGGHDHILDKVVKKA